VRRSATAVEVALSICLNVTGCFIGKQELLQYVHRSSVADFVLYMGMFLRFRLVYCFDFVLHVLIQLHVLVFLARRCSHSISLHHSSIFTIFSIVFRACRSLFIFSCISRPDFYGVQVFHLFGD
jgi:hypothetical protein